VRLDAEFFFKVFIEKLSFKKYYGFEYFEVLGNDKNCSIKNCGISKTTDIWQC
jgi:hypothetical protein